MLKGIEETAADTIILVQGISKLMAEYKIIMRDAFGKNYRHELLNNLFYHPYTKVEYVEKELMVTRQTASKYLDKIVELGLLQKLKVGRSNYYINDRLAELFINRAQIKTN